VIENVRGLAGRAVAVARRMKGSQGDESAEISAPDLFR